MGKIYQVVVHGLRGQKMTLDLCNTEEQFKSLTVRQLKEKLAQKLPETTDLKHAIFADCRLEALSNLLCHKGIDHKTGKSRSMERLLDLSDNNTGTGTPKVQNN